MKTIQPSFLAFDSRQLKKQLFLCQQQQINTIHYDVMDQKYVNNIAFDERLIDTITSYDLKVSVHLMTKNVIAQVQKYLAYPVSAITIHGDADILSNVHYALDLINATPNIAAGLAIKGYETIKFLLPLLQKVQFVIIMGVNPGAGGQKYQSITNYQLIQLDKLKREHNLVFQVILDGGVNPEVIKATKNYVDVYVTGSYLMQASDFTTTYQKLVFLANH